MPLSPIVRRYFKAWVKRETWHTLHDSDYKYFYMFVHSIARYSREPFDEAGLEALIVAEANRATIGVDQLKKRASHYSDLCRHLVEFKQTAFPNPLIERRNIYAYYNALLCSCKGDNADAQIAEIMQRSWGDDWENKMGLGTFKNSNKRASPGLEVRTDDGNREAAK